MNKKLNSRDLAPLYKQYQSFQGNLALANEESTIANSTKSELLSFQNELKDNQHCFHQNPYTANKKKMRAYKNAFLFLGIVFASLTAWILGTNPSWEYQLIFVHNHFPKLFMAGVAALFALLSFSLSMLLQAEYEIASKLYQSAKAKIRHFYYKHQKTVDSSHSFFDSEYKHFLAVKATCKEALDEIEEKKIELYHLLRHISRARNKSRPEKETLLNQALLSFKGSLDEIVEKARG